MPDLLHQIQDRLNVGNLRDNLPRLFCETLNWGRASAQPRPLAVSAPVGRTITALPVAQLGGLPVFCVDWDSAKLPNVLQRRAVHRALAPTHLEHLLCYVTNDAKQAAFVWARQKSRDKIELRTLPYEVASPARTTIERLNEMAFTVEELGLFAEPPISAVTDKLNAAFDVEAVTKRFFREYKELFEEAEKQIKGIQGDNRRLFTQKVFNRLLFIRFLEKKGWLNFNGRRDYLRALWDDYRAKAREGENFYRDRLQHLFFSGLNTPHEVNLMEINAGGFLATLIGNVPYLNGGLFEQDETDRNDKIVVPDQVIEPILTDLFYRFNFTVTEATPLDIEVAVDPEMLGKIFEELVTGRHETGSYYTPKPIVSFMCRESLKIYLTTQCPQESAEAIAELVDEHETKHLHQPERIIEALRRIKVCDLACGSGAYLLGMMHELLDLRHTLFANYQLDPRTVYERKLEIIENNLYGVDKDPFAINVARLRLWLSLIVDYEGETPLPLPNLDFKIEVGDSLTAPNPQSAQQMGMRDELVKQFDQKKAEFGRTHHYGEKQTLRDEIAKLRQQIAQWTHAGSTVQGFDWKVEFAEVFANGGFDVVIANPPYVRADAQFKHIQDEDERQSAIADWKDYRAALLKSSVYRTLYEKWDLYLPFLERGYQLLRGDASMVFIIPDAYNAAKYARKSHEFFLLNARIASINFCSDIPLFDAGVSNTIVHFAKAAPTSNHCPVRIRRWGESPDDFQENAKVLPTMVQGEFGLTLFRPDGADQRTQTQDGAIVLERICFISKGMVTNSDEKEYKGLFKSEDLLSEKKDAKHPKPFVEGKDLVKWCVQRVRFLEWGTRRVPSKLSRPTFPQLHEPSEKLLAVRTPGAVPKVVYDSEKIFYDASSVGFVAWHCLKGVKNNSLGKVAKYRGEKGTARLPREELENTSKRFNIKYLLAIMNSTWTREWLAKRRRSKMHVYPDDWKQLPIAPIPMEQQQPFVKLVDTILAEFEKHGYPLPPDAARRVAESEREIDARAAALYGL